MKAVAIILSAGSGSRFSKHQPKQFFNIKGHPLLFYTIKAFHSSPCIDEIVVVSHGSYIEDVKTLVKTAHFDKVLHVVEGGQQRCDSTYQGLKLYDETSERKILIHDGARPLIDCEQIQNCVQALDSYPACAVAIEATDTIFEVEDERIKSVPDRKLLYLGQTPQCFHLSVIKRAYKMAKENGDISFSDDCGLVKKYLPDTEIHIIKGKRENIKLTFPNDAKYLELFL